MMSTEKEALIMDKIKAETESIQAHIKRENERHAQELKHKDERHKHEMTILELEEAKARNEMI